MFRIEKLVMHNFGAYYDKQEIVFPSDNGVCIVWGENGFGKTTITNAFRYVLWDTIYGRKRVIRDPKSFVNTDAANLGKDMLVELLLNVEGEKYTITRGLRNMGAGNYQNIFSIEHNGQLFGPDEANEWLNNLLPFEISRFYVFDGELLDEYEDLLEEGSVSGEKLKSSIEDILGIPVLINARENLKTLVSEADTEVQKEASKSKDTEQWAISLAGANEKKQELLESKCALENELKEKTNECSDIEERLKSNSKLSELITKKNDLETSIHKLEQKIEEKSTKIKDKIDSIWKYEVCDIATSMVKQELADTADLNEAKRKCSHFEYVSEFLEQQLKHDGEHCPLCNSPHSNSTLNSILSEFKKNRNGLLSKEDEDKLRKSQEKVSALQSLCAPQLDFGYTRDLIDEVREDEAELILSNNALTDYYDQIKNFGGNNPDIEAEIASLPGKLKIALKVIEELKQGLEDNKKALELVDKSIENCNANIKRLSSDKGANNATAKRDFVNKLYLTFDESIASFRDQIRENVERDATDSFKKICHQDEFNALKINDNFGLHILKTDGSIVPNRSSGYEQVVAISLISGLHKNAPIAGPVFLDSTFQRVDIKHKIRTLQNLSVLSDQIIILAYPKEIGDENEVRKVLGNQLKKEINIKQLSSSKSYFD